MNVIRNDFKTWKRFVKEGVLDESRIQKRVAAHGTAAKADVNPYLEKVECNAGRSFRKA